MADYINKNILSQAYIHVEPTSLQTEEELEEFKKYIIDFAKSRSSFYLYPDSEIDIEFEEGSIKARITVMGTVFLLMQGISNYPDFREGIRLLYKDAKQFSEYIISEAQYLSGSKHEDVIRVEARTGIVGSLHKINLQLEQIENGAEGTMLVTSLVKKLDKVQEEIESLMANLQDEDDKKLITDGLSSLVKEFPKIPTPPKNQKNKPEDIAVYQEKRRRLREYLGLAV